MYNDNNNDIDDYYSVPLADEDVYPFASSLSFKYKKIFVLSDICILLRNGGSNLNRQYR